MQILILAAGSSRRMGGRDKLAEPAPHVPLLRQIASEAVATGLPVRVVLPPDAPARAALIDDLPLRRVIAAQAARGMGLSLRAGLGDMPPGDSVMIVLADLPDLRRAHLDQVIAAARNAPGRALRGCAADGQPGHPVVLPPDLWARALRLEGDIGARDLLAGADPVLIPLPGRVAVTDLDTPADWDGWRAAADR